MQTKLFSTRGYIKESLEKEKIDAITVLRRYLWNENL